MSLNRILNCVDSIVWIRTSILTFEHDKSHIQVIEHTVSIKHLANQHSRLFKANKFFEKQVKRNTRLINEEWSDVEEDEPLQKRPKTGELIKKASPTQAS